MKIKNFNDYIKFGFYKDAIKHLKDEFPDYYLKLEQVVKKYQNREKINFPEIINGEYVSGERKGQKADEADLIISMVANFLFDRNEIERVHWNWKGGKTSTNHLIRSSRRYHKWRLAVFSRDNFTCVNCGKVGGRLNAHHIERFAKNEDKRLDVNNGITLCEKCHRELHRLEGK